MFYNKPQKQLKMFSQGQLKQIENQGQLVNKIDPQNSLVLIRS